MALKLETQIEIDAPPEDVWKILMDFERHEQWNPFIVGIHGDKQVGAQITARMHPPDGKPMTFKPLITRLEPERQFVWVGNLFAAWLFSGEHIFVLEPLGAGRTRFRHEEHFGGILVPLLKKSLQTNTRRGFELMNQALKDEVEKRG